MNRFVQIKLKYILLSLITIFTLLYLLVFPREHESKTSIKTIEKIVVTKKIDSASINLTKKTPTKILYKFIKNPKDTTAKKTIVANQYKDTINLKNGAVYSNIISTGKVLKHDLKLINYDSLIIRTTEIKSTKHITKNTLFLNYEPIISILPIPTVIGHQVSIDYTIRNKVRLGFGVGYNSQFSGNKTYGTLKIGIKL